MSRADLTSLSLGNVLSVPNNVPWGELETPVGCVFSPEMSIGQRVRDEAILIHLCICKED